jgi:hypothetical protein
VVYLKSIACSIKYIATFKATFSATVFSNDSSKFGFLCKKKANVENNKNAMVVSCLVLLSANV